MRAPRLSPRFRVLVWLGLLVFSLVEALAVSVSAKGSDMTGLREVLAVSLIVFVVSLRVTWGTLAAFVVAMLTIPFWDANSYLLGTVLIAMMVARTVDRTFGVASIVLYAIWSVTGAVYGGLAPVSVLGADLVVAVGVVAGLLMRLQGRKMERIQRDLTQQETQRQKAVDAERRQIGAELHDVVAHGLTIVAMQSSILEMEPTESERLSAQRAIGDAARQSLLDLRRMLSVLHGTDQSYGVEGDELTVSLEVRVVEYSERLRAAGFTVETLFQESAALSRSLQLTLVRVMQECTTNILKHVDPPAKVSFVLEARDAVGLTIRNPLPEPGRRGVLPTSGFGMIGLRERVELFGGTFSYGPESGDWVVRVGFTAGSA